MVLGLPIPCFFCIFKCLRKSYFKEVTSVSSPSQLVLSNETKTYQQALCLYLIPYIYLLQKRGAKMVQKNPI